MRALFVSLLLLAAACGPNAPGNPDAVFNTLSGNSSAANYAERDARLASTTAPIFLTGCFAGTTATVGTDLRAAIAGGSPIVVRWLSTYELVTAGRLEYDWFVQPDGAGDLYWEWYSDYECFDPTATLYCGLHKTSFAAGVLYGATGLHLRNEDSTWELTDFTFCGG